MPLFHTKTDHLSRLLYLLDLVLVTLTYIVLLRLHPYFSMGQELDFSMHLGLLPIILISFTMGRQLFGRDTGLQIMSIRTQTACLLREIGFTFAVTAALIFLLKLQFVSRSVLFGFAVFTPIIIVLARIFIRWWYFTKRKEKQADYLNILIIGSGQRARDLADRLQKKFEWGVNIVGFLDPVGQSAGRRATDEILGHVNQISNILRDSVIEEVIVAVPRSMLGNVQKIIDACQEEGVRLRFMADIYDFEAARVGLSMIDEIPLLSFEPVSRGENVLIGKRFFDILVVIIAILMIMPVLALVAIAIKIDSPGPAIFCQVRVGLHKRRFELYKFRSMVVDAESRMKDVEHLNEANGPNFKIDNDPRVTSLGRILRKTSIDELPQLWNVLKGDMSLVGPRPMSIRDVDLFERGIQRKRFSVRPGITCLWQVSGRSDLSFDDWLRLDLKYINEWSPWLDLKILFKTIPAVFKGSGAV